MARAEKSFWYIIVALLIPMGLLGLLMMVKSANLYDRLVGLAGGLFFLAGGAFIGIQLRGQSRFAQPTLGRDPASNLPALMFHENPLRMWLLILACTGMALVGLMLIFVALVPVETSQSVSFWQRAGAFILGALVLAFAVWAIVSAYRRVRNPSSALVITSESLQFTYGTQRVSVEWSQLEAVFPYALAGDVGVAFALNEAEQPSRGLQQVNKATAGFDWGVSLGSAPEPIVALIEFYRAHPELRHEIGTPASLERYRAYWS